MKKWTACRLSCSTCEEPYLQLCVNTVSLQDDMLYIMTMKYTMPWYACKGHTCNMSASMCMGSVLLVISSEACIHSSGDNQQQEHERMPWQQQRQKDVQR